jgi:hypothetical protein
VSAEAYFADIGKAADDLGYGIVEVRVGDITLRPNDKSDIVVRIETDRGYFPIDGALLRDLLVVRPKK